MSPTCCFSTCGVLKRTRRAYNIMVSGAAVWVREPLRRFEMWDAGKRL
jgi:hypothetical protein